MGYTVRDLAERVAGDVHGQATLEITGAQSISHAGPHDITFLAGEKQLPRLKLSRAGAVVVGRTLLPRVLEEGGVPACIGVDDPLAAFVVLLKEFRPLRPRAALGVSPQACVSRSARIGPGTNVYPGAYIGDAAEIGAQCDIYPGAVIGADCRIGDQCTIHPHAVLYPQTVLGQRVLVHAGAVLGADGFGYRFQQGRFEKIPQLGFVLVEDDVEIGACTTIDRGMIGPTTIGTGTKLDNLVMIGHNCEIGKHNAFASQVGLAGSVTTGDYVRCAGQVGIADHVHLGTGCTLGAKAGVHKDMAAGGRYLGIPATDDHEQIKMVMSLRKLPELLKQSRDLEQQIARLSEEFQRFLDQRRSAAGQTAPAALDPAA